MVRTLLKKFLGSSENTRTAPRSAPRLAARLGVEDLEGRLVPSVTSFTLTAPASVIVLDQTFNLAAQAYNSSGKATGYDGSPTLNWNRTDSNGNILASGTESITFSSGTWSQLSGLSQAYTYHFWITGPATSNTVTIQGKTAVLTSITLSPTRENPLPLGSEFVGQSFQLGISAYDQGGYYYVSPLSVSLYDNYGSDQGTEIPLGGNNTVPLTNGFASLSLTPAESAISEGGGTVAAPAIFKATQILPPGTTGPTVSATTTITAITTGFVFNVYASNSAFSPYMTVTIPTTGTGDITVYNPATGTTQNTGVTLGLLATQNPSVYNWVIGQLQNNAGAPGTNANAMANSSLFSFLLAYAGYSLSADPTANLGQGVGNVGTLN